MGPGLVEKARLQSDLMVDVMYLWVIVNGCVGRQWASSVLLYKHTSIVIHKENIIMKFQVNKL